MEVGALIEGGQHWWFFVFFFCSCELGGVATFLCLMEIKILWMHIPRMPVLRITFLTGKEIQQVVEIGICFVMGSFCKIQGRFSCEKKRGYKCCLPSVLLLTWFPLCPWGPASSLGGAGVDPCCRHSTVLQGIEAELFQPSSMHQMYRFANMICF